MARVRMERKGAASTVVVREAVAVDAGLILAFVRELAAAQGYAGDVVRNSEDAILHEGFGERPAFEALIAEVDGEAAGMALCYWTYSTWTGRRGLYVDDLIVREAQRGSGVGVALLAAAARKALAAGSLRLDLQVRAANPARGFYERLGLVHLADWLPYRAEGEALAALAATGAGSDA